MCTYNKTRPAIGPHDQNKAKQSKTKQTKPKQSKAKYPSLYVHIIKLDQRWARMIKTMRNKAKQIKAKQSKPK